MATKNESTLHSIGKILSEAFSDSEKITLAAEPFVDLAFPAIAPLYNVAAQGAALALKAATAAVTPGASDVANLTAVTIAVAPVLNQFAATAGLTPPAIGTVIQYAGALQKSLAVLAGPATK